MADTERILLLIERRGLKRKKIAEMMGISVTSLWRKINGKSEFDAREIVAFSDILGVSSNAERDRLFLRKSG
jgi:transcriptional regulator with XRE-family HTH domain